MNKFHRVLVCAALAAVCGCRSDPNVPLLERELRMQEDRMYELQECVDDFKIALDSARRENAALRRQIESPSSDAPGPKRPARSPEGQEIAPPTIEMPGAKDQSSAGPKLTDEIQFPGPQLSASGAVPGQPDGEKPSLGKVLRAMTPTIAKADSDEVAKITLSPLLTGGNKPQRTGPDTGITVLIEPRNAKGDLVEASAPVSIVVLDPALQDESARVARWEFTPAEIAEAFRRVPTGSGVYLELPWPSAPPTHNELRVYVRFTTRDGRKLETDRTIHVDLDGSKASWKGKKETAPSESAPAASEPEASPPKKPAKPTASPSGERARRASDRRQSLRPTWTPYR